MMFSHPGTGSPSDSHALTSVNFCCRSGHDKGFFLEVSYGDLPRSRFMGDCAEPVRYNAVMEPLCGDGYSERETLGMTPEETPQERPEGPSARFFEAQCKKDF